MKCLECSKDLTGKQKKCCSNKCLKKHYFREYYKINREKLLIKNRLWNESHKEKIQESSRKQAIKKRFERLVYRKNNPKFCKKCNNEIPIESKRSIFCSRKCAIDWHNKEDYYARRDKINRNPFLKYLDKKKRRKYYKENKDKYLEANKRWIAKNPERYKEIIRKAAKRRYDKVKDKEWFKKLNRERVTKYYWKNKLDRKDE